MPPVQMGVSDMRQDVRHASMGAICHPKSEGLTRSHIYFGGCSALLMPFMPIAFPQRAGLRRFPQVICHKDAAA